MTRDVTGDDIVSPNPETTEVEREPGIATRRRFSPRLLGLAVVTGILVTLGIGALADALAVAPLRPPTRGSDAQQAGLYTVALAVNPAPLTSGAQTTFTLRVSDVSGKAVSAARITCDYTMPAMPMPTMLVAASESGAGVYTCRETLTDPGAWALTVTLAPPGDAAVHTTFALQAR